MQALGYPECTKLMGPIVPGALLYALAFLMHTVFLTTVSGTIVPNGCHVPGTNYCLDPVQAAFNIGCMNRWLDFNARITSLFF